MFRSLLDSFRSDIGETTWKKVGDVLDQAGPKPSRARPRPSAKSHAKVRAQPKPTRAHIKRRDPKPGPSQVELKLRQTIQNQAETIQSLQAQTIQNQAETIQSLQAETRQNQVEAILRQTIQDQAETIQSQADTIQFQSQAQAMCVAMSNIPKAWRPRMVGSLPGKPAALALKDSPGPKIVPPPKRKHEEAEVEVEVEVASEAEETEAIGWPQFCEDHWPLCIKFCISYRHFFGWDFWIWSRARHPYRPKVVRIFDDFGTLDSQRQIAHHGKEKELFFGKAKYLFSL